MTAINAALRGKKRLDLFQCARVDPNHPIEETIGVLKGFVAEGLFDHIGMSECSAATLRRGNAVHPITAVEIEVSPWSMEEETKSVLATAEELGIAVIGYAQVSFPPLSAARALTRPPQPARPRLPHRRDQEPRGPPW